MIWFTLLALCILVSLILIWRWRSSVIANDQPFPMQQSILIIGSTVIVGLLAWQFIGRHTDTVDWLGQYHTHQAAVSTIVEGNPVQQVEEIPIGILVNVLQRELQRNPSAQGWYALSLMYEQLEAPEQAKKSARKAVSLSNGEAEPRLLLVRTLLSSSDAAVIEEAAGILDELLVEQPGHDGATMFRAIVAARLSDYATAIEIWENMLAEHPEGEAAQALKLALDDARQKQIGIERFGNISISVEAADGIQAGGTLFVFLRKSDQLQGQPLAARRVLADRFPITVQIRPSDWLQAFPQTEIDLVSGARYDLGVMGSVDSAAITAPIVTLKGANGTLNASVLLSSAAQ